MQPSIVFDVNETLLDVRALAPRFSTLFGDDTLLGPWFAQMLRNALVASATSVYAPFDVQGTDALVTVAASSGFDVSWDDARHVVAAMAALPPHPDVADGLDELIAAGYSLAALTNSAPAMVADQLAFAGLDEYFSVVQSVEPSGRFKPHPEPYLLMAETLGVPPAELWLVAAHDWDVTGAMRVGMRGAFIGRGGRRYSLLGERPDVIGRDLSTVARRIVELRGQPA